MNIPLQNNFFEEPFINTSGIAPLPIKLYQEIPRKKNGIDFDIYNYSFLFNDDKTKHIIRNGLTIGCFYIESPGMRSLLKKLDVDTFEMLTAASSVIRPGVAESGMMQEFIARHKDPSRRKYLLPEMENVLGETYGVMIYQEDVIKVAYHIAGLSLEEADVLRRGMSGKMRSHKAMQLIEEKFYQSCYKKGFSSSITKELWRQIESFAGYSFCKAHSASFALLSYQVAYLKAHFPAEFMACVLNNGGGFYASAVYIQEAKRLGIKILLPCINNSFYEYKGKEKEIRIGLMAVKNFSFNSVQVITEERKKHGRYVSLPDFITRTRIGIKETELLIKCGAMDCLKETRCTLLRWLDVYFNKLSILDESYNDLFINEAFALEREVKTNKDFSIVEKCLAEYDAFNYMVTKHPLDFFTEWNKKLSLVSADRMHLYKGKKIKMIGWYISSKRVKTKKDDIMKFLSLEDLTGTYEAVIFPRAYYKVAEKTLSMGPYIVEGRVDAESHTNLIVENLDLISNSIINEESRQYKTDQPFMPDDEGLKEEDIYSSVSLNKEKLKAAYTG